MVPENHTQGKIKLLGSEFHEFIHWNNNADRSR